jgi:rhodanese-related sulfurtransferase
VNDLLAEARSRLGRLRPAEALAAQRTGAVIVDIRPREFREEAGVIPGSVWIPLNVLEWRFDPRSPHRDERVAQPNRHIVLICYEGYSSSLAAARLQTLGFAHVTDVVDGFEGWLAARLPIEEAPTKEGIPGA